MNPITDALGQQMQEMKQMFEGKFKELKARNKVLFNKAVEKHFQSIKYQDENTIQTDQLSSNEQRIMDSAYDLNNAHKMNIPATRHQKRVSGP